jgi:hypothetical protein
VVDVERARDAAHVPAGPGLAPDRLAERQRGRQRRRGAEVDRVPGDRAGVVVFDDGQPRPARPAGRGEHPQVQQGVVGLPDLVRLGGLAAVHQVEQLLVPLGALVRERGHRRVDALHHVVHRDVARHRPPLRPGHLGHLPVHRGDRGWRAAQSRSSISNCSSGGIRRVPRPSEAGGPAQPWNRNTRPSTALRSSKTDTIRHVLFQKSSQETYSARRVRR